MIDETIMDKIIPLPDEDEAMEDIREELEGEGFIITNFSKGGVFYTLVRIMVFVYRQILVLARDIVNNCFMKHAAGDWADIKAADYGKYRKEAKRARGYLTVSRSDSRFSLEIQKGHMFKTMPDAAGTEWKFHAVRETVIDAGEQTGMVLVEAEQPGTGYNLLPGKITVSMIHMESVEGVSNERGWLLEEGTDEETDESLRERCTGSFSELALRTTGEKIKNAAESVNGVVAAEIDAQHPRGQGTVDIYITGTAGEATDELIRNVSAAVDKLKGNYEDYLVKSAEISRQDFVLTIWLAENASKDGVKEAAEDIINSLLGINRKELNRFYRDSLIQAFAERIIDYRTADITIPAGNIMLDKGTVVLAGDISINVKNIGEAEDV